MPLNNSEGKDNEGKGKNVWKTFVINVSFVILLFVLGIFTGMFINNERMIDAELKSRARSYFNGTLLTWRWNAEYGGVFVEKKNGTVSSPYLESPDIMTHDGKTYTKKNHALMTREIAELSEKYGDYQFHITSLDPLNPDNTPDDFEKKSLKSFEKGEKEVFFKQKTDNRTDFRYMAPLYTEEPCLECHENYKPGDVRGGISVKFNINEVEKSLEINRYMLLGFFVLTLAFLLSIIYFFIYKLNQKLTVALERLQIMSITDDLTKLNNRRYFFTRLKEEFKRSKRHKHHLSCILLDIDFFKNVNDSYGHQAGDVVLREIARIFQDNCRKHETVARYGGEEFIQLLPETSHEAALYVAERLRSLVELLKIEVDEATQVMITISVGVASFTPDSLEKLDKVNQIVKMVDEALYKAKKNGRNRVESA